MAISTAHGVTNIEGFESGSVNEPPNNQLLWNNMFMIANPIAHSGNYMAWAFPGPGVHYGQLPISFSPSGLASGLDKGVVVVRFYFLPWVLAGVNWGRIFGAGFNWNLPPGTETAYLEINPAGNLRINGGAASALAIPGGPVWVKIELLLNAADNIQEVYVNDVPFATNTANILPMDYVNIGDFVGGGGLGGSLFAWDDLLIESDDSPLKVNLPFDGGNNLRLLQDGDSAGVNQWNAFPGPAKWTGVDETPPNDAVDYVWTFNINDAQEFTYQAPAAAGIVLGPNDSIKAVKVQTRHTFINATPGIIQRLRSGATLDSTTFQFTMVNWASRLSKVYQFDPDTGADWTIGPPNGLDGVETGVENTGPNFLIEAATWQGLTVDFGLEFLPSIFLPKINPEVIGPLELINRPEVGRG